MFGVSPVDEEANRVHPSPVWALHNKPWVTKLNFSFSSTIIPSLVYITQSSIVPGNKSHWLDSYLIILLEKSLPCSIFSEPEREKEIALPIKTNLYLLENCIPPSLSVSIHSNPPSALMLFKPGQMWHTTQRGFTEAQHLPKYSVTGEVHLLWRQHWQVKKKKR